MNQKMKKMLQEETLPFWGNGTDYPTIREAREAGVSQSEIDFVLWNWGYICSLPEDQNFILKSSNEAFEGKTQVTVGYARERALKHKEAYEMFLAFIRDTFVRV